MATNTNKKENDNKKTFYLLTNNINALCLSYCVASTMNCDSHHNSGLLCLIIGCFPKTTFIQIKIKIIFKALKDKYCDLCVGSIFGDYNSLYPI